MGVDPESILKKYWGYSTFRPGQRGVIDDILTGHPVLALFPTGGGKSICYQVPGLILTGLTLVVSPLISLMKDQVDDLVKKDIQSVTLHSGLARGEIRLIMENALKGRYKFMYVSPERLASTDFREYLPNLDISLLVVDEAHCISQWGHDFRPSYLRIAEILPLLRNYKLAAFTASAPPRVKKDIIQYLFVGKPIEHHGDFFRPNLQFQVIKTENKSGHLLRLLKKIPGNKMIFCDTRRETEEMARFLNASGFQCEFYHAGLNRETRTQKQDVWIRSKEGIMACTNAFGMGVNKPDVRLVVHLTPPVNPEAYYQEAGRAGRDGLKSRCVILYREHEIDILRERIEQNFPSEKELVKAYHAVFNFYGFADGAGSGVSATFDLQAISDRYRISQVGLLTGVNNIAFTGLWTITEGLYMPTRFRFIYPYQDLYEFKLRNNRFEALIDVILRSYGGVFDDFVKLSEITLSRRLKIKPEILRELLTELSHMGVAEYHFATDLPVITFNEPRSASPKFPMNLLQKLKSTKLEGLATMEQYLNLTNCRSAFWTAYFSGEVPQSCGICDNCVRRKKEAVTGIGFDQNRNRLYQFLGNEGKSRNEILEWSGKDEELLEVFRYLVDQRFILLDVNQKYYRKPE